MNNPYESYYRLKKAETLATALLASKLSSDEVSEWPGIIWASAAEIAGLKHKPSEETIRMTIKLMRDRENALIAAAIVREEMAGAAL